MQEKKNKAKWGGQPPFDWDGFKRTEFAVICQTDKQRFLGECKKNGIHSISLSEFAIQQRSVFVCVMRYENRLSNGRYELFALKGWETKPNGLYGSIGIPEIHWISATKKGENDGTAY